LRDFLRELQVDQRTIDETVAQVRTVFRRWASWSQSSRICRHRLRAAIALGGDTWANCFIVAAR